MKYYSLFGKQPDGEMGASLNMNLEELCTTLSKILKGELLLDQETLLVKTTNDPF